MTPIKTIEEIKAGDIVTISEWKTINCRSWLGQPMTVKLVDSPYLIVDISKAEKNDYEYKNRVLLFNEYQFQKPSVDYIEMLKQVS